MTLEEEARENLRRLLALTWRPWAQATLDSGQVTRSWSLDLGWLSPVDADEVLARLVQSGWVTSDGGGLLPGVDLEGVEIPLGWFPRQNLLLEPPSLPPDKSAEPKDGVESPSRTGLDAEPFPTDGSETIKESIEREDSSLSDDIPTLLEAISSGCGLERQEVMRRAQRKIRALGDITLWMSLALVAREQGLELTELFQGPS